MRIFSISTIGLIVFFVGSIILGESVLKSNQDRNRSDSQNSKTSQLNIPKTLITGSGVRMRADRTTRGKVLKSLNLGDEVSILEESDQLQTIGKMKAKWFKVKIDAVIGWFYGGLL